ADGPDPTDAVRTHVEALDRGDAVAAAAVFADTAVHIHPLATGLCSRQSPCSGRAAILADLKNRVADHYCLALLDLATTGSIVRGAAELRSDTLRSLGIERVLVASTWVVVNQQATALFVVPDLSDPQTAASAAISAGSQAPGAPIPTPATPCG